MNVLLVDDQELIVNSIKEGLTWDKLGVDKVYCATNSYEAKFLIMNYPIDLLITDIEMPEEDGIALAEWVQEFSEEIIIVFLTSHPSFQYAREGLRLHVFDYLLQPIRFSELSDLVSRVEHQIRQRHESKRNRQNALFARQHRNAVFDSLVLKALNNREEDMWDAWNDLEELYRKKHGGFVVYLMLFTVHQWELVHREWTDRLIRTVLSNILGEIYEEEEAEVGIANIDAGNYWGFLQLKEAVDREIFRKRTECFLEQVERTGAFRISRIARDMPVKRQGLVLRELKKQMLAGAKPGTIYWEDISCGKGEGQDAVRQSIAYIEEHIYLKLSRQEVAAQVHLNPEYFSKLFRRETGLSFKDFVLQEKMKRAAGLLSDTKMPVGLIASRVGFDNFSHFSQTFRGYYKMSPQEYRQKHETS